MVSGWRVSHGNVASLPCLPLRMSTNNNRDLPLSRHHSPVTALASLESLQQIQRRGSITDPYLHAATKSNTNYRHPADQYSSAASSGPSSTHQDSTSKHYLADPRPSSPYVFGDATIHSGEPSSQLRKILHSPSSDHMAPRQPPSLSHESHPSSRSHSGTSLRHLYM